MARVQDNWARLVRAVLRNEQRAGHERSPSGIAGSVPDSLRRSTNINAILQAADEIQSEDPNVARILCEQAYSMAQDLDPNSDGRGVLQFKTGLMSVIKQKLAKKDGGPIDRNRDMELLWDFYNRFKRRHRVDDIEREEQKWRESGTYSTNIGDLDLRFTETKKVFATLRALVEVMDALSKDAAPSGVGRLIMDELRRVKQSDATISGELVPYNIVPLEAPSMTNAIGYFPEVRGAISALKYTQQFPRLPAGFEISGQRDLDMFDLLEYVFGFQKDNIRNQREHVVLTLANTQSRLGIAVEADPKLDERAIREVFLKVLDNYIKWCRYLRIRLVWNSLEAINRERKLFLVSLYLCIWGEAVNIRFLPECICTCFTINLNPTSSGGDDPADGAGGRREACISGGTGFGSVPAESDGVLQGFQRLNPEIQARNPNGRDDNGVHRQHVRVHGSVAVGDVVPEEGGGDRERERAGRSRDGVDNHAEARVRDREDQAE